MNFFPMNAGGGNVEMDLLWTNSAPTTAMTTLSIPLDLSGYEYFVVYTENKSGYYANYENHDYCMKASNQFVGTYYGTGSGAYRYFDFSDSGIEIGDIYNSNVNYRLYCQPTKIYGIRKGAGGSSGGGSIIKGCKFYIYRNGVGDHYVEVDAKIVDVSTYYKGSASSTYPIGCTIAGSSDLSTWTDIYSFPNSSVANVTYTQNDIDVSEYKYISVYSKTNNNNYMGIADTTITFKS